MALILGIDTGGTFTDAVVFHTETKQILCKAKAFTTKENLCTGIEKALDCLDFNDLSQIERVHLSTTLATNSILENNITNVGVVLLGKDLKEKRLCGNKYVIPGGQAPDKKQFYEMKQFFSCNVDAIVVSTYGVKRDSQKEEHIAYTLQSLMGLPVYCAKNTSSALGFCERTVTAVINAGLIPIVSGWINCMKNVLSEKKISAPIYILKGDGLLMDENEAVRKPVHTVLSGPAASVAGGRFLSGKKDFLLIDIGGTSADVTKLENDTLRLCNSSTKIADLPISVKSLDIQSFPVGGDSHIHYNQMGELTIGPEKVVPLCVASHSFPHLYEELLAYEKPDHYELLTTHETDCFTLGSRTSTTSLSDFERKIVGYLKESPHSLFHIADQFDTDPDSLHLAALVKQGYLQKVSFTPTDLLHVTGDYSRWDCKISTAAAAIMSQRKGYSSELFIEKCHQLITDQLVFSCMQSIANFEKKKFDFRSSSGTMYLLQRYLKQNNPYLSLDFKITRPIVAVGAPAGAWMKPVAGKLGADLVLPDHYEVASAVGAAISPYTAEQEVQ